MTSYFQYNDERTKKPPKRTEHGTEIIDIPGILVTESSMNDRHGWACPCVECRIDRGEETL